jgi:mannosyltransferase OCH1-like enzyme
MTIPKIIWQTYETPFKELLPEAKACIQTWIDKNPKWNYIYMNAEERESFVLREFGKDWHDLFIGCNLGIVKANIWRCMVTYVYGGVYCDLDTKCNDPIDTWIDNRYIMILARDDDGNPEEFAIHTFASAPQNKVLLLILEEIKHNLANNKIKIKDVISLSGETVWTKIIKGLEDEYNIFCYPKKSNMFNGKATTHLGTSKKWFKDGYVQWMKTKEGK